MWFGDTAEFNDTFSFPVDFLNLCWLHFFLYEKKNSSLQF